VLALAEELGYPMLERDLARAELYLADEVFLSGTAAELVPVREIDDHAIGTGEPGPVTRAIQAAFDDALHGRDTRHADWLDLIELPRQSAPVAGS
jgi:branched-chain amino acid aminotransferase